jgi:bile acid:Na+ symporter, BASS family
MKSDILIQVILPASLFIIMLGMGLSLKLADFKLVLAQPKAVVLGLFAQIVMLPLVAYLVVLAFGLHGAMAMGLMILALCPGGTTSNLYTYLAKGDVALSVTLTSVVSLIAPITVPIMIAVLMGIIMGDGQSIELPLLKTVVQLLIITVIPIGIGMTINHFKPTFSAKVESSVKVFSMAVLLLIVMGIVLKNIDNMGSYFAEVGLAALVLNLCCLCMAYALAKLARLNDAQSRAISIEVGFQNGTLAIMIALTLLHNNDMAIAATCYSIIMFATGALFAKLLSRRVVEWKEVDA